MTLKPSISRSFYTNMKSINSAKIENQKLKIKVSRFVKNKRIQETYILSGNIETLKRVEEWFKSYDKAADTLITAKKLKIRKQKKNPA